MSEIEWAAPPPPSPRKADVVAAQLRAKPNQWARIDSGEMTLFPWWTPLSNAKDFEIKFVRANYPDGMPRLFGPRDVYARYVGEAKS